VENGLWFARSDEFIGSEVFKSLTWLRGIGGGVFLFGGVIPLMLFIVSRAKSLKHTSEVVTILDKDGPYINEEAGPKEH
jgi:nitric oxide reductase subunit B